MGSFVEINDTLQLNIEQGFPAELDFDTHKNKQFKAKDFANRIFIFKNKSKIRLYKSPPVRNFLVQNINGKWLYWGLVHVTEVTHDYINQTTSGKFKIIYIYTPEEMKIANQLIDRNEETDYFN